MPWWRMAGVCCFVQSGLPNCRVWRLMRQVIVGGCWNRERTWQGVSWWDETWAPLRICCHEKVASQDGILVTKCDRMLLDRTCKKCMHNVTCAWHWMGGSSYAGMNRFKFAGLVGFCHLSLSIQTPRSMAEIVAKALGQCRRFGKHARYFNPEVAWCFHANISKMPKNQGTL